MNSETSADHMVRERNLRILALGFGSLSISAIIELKANHPRIEWAILAESPSSVEEFALAYSTYKASTLGSPSFFVDSSVSLGEGKSCGELGRQFDLVLALGSANQRYFSVLGEMRSKSTLVLPFALMPFSFEHKEVCRDATESIRVACRRGEPVIVASGDWILREDKNVISIEVAQIAAIDLLSGCMNSILDLLSQGNRTALSFRDLASFLENGCVLVPARVTARGGERSEIAARRLLEFYRREDIRVDRSSKILFCVYGGHSLTLWEVAKVARIVADHLSPDADVISAMMIESERDLDLEVIAMCGGFGLTQFDLQSPFSSTDPLLEERVFRKEEGVLLRRKVGLGLGESQTIQRLRVFLSSPSDVKRERSAISGVIAELNRITPDLFGVFLELVSWESHVVPDMGRPQDVINRQIGDIDVFIGILGRRIGSPTGAAVSGTVEEFQLALDLFERLGRPRILFYFADRPRPDKGLAAAEQWLEVEKFRSEFERKGLYWTYSSIGGFERIVYRHLLRVAQEVDHGV